MKRIIYLFLILTFLFSPWVVPAQDQPSSQPHLLKSPPLKQTVKKHPSRETRMRASGTVVEITDDSITIQRTVTLEIMVFNLEKPVSGINVGDKVTVSYVKIGEKNVAKKVSKIREQGTPSSVPSKKVK